MDSAVSKHAEISGVISLSANGREAQPSRRDSDQQLAATLAHVTVTGRVPALALFSVSFLLHAQGCSLGKALDL